MFHAVMTDGKVLEDNTTVYEYFCVECGHYVTTETCSYLEFLQRTRQACYCSKCDPLIDVVPEIFDVDFITVGPYTVDVKKSIGFGFPLVLFTTQSCS